MMTPSGGSTDPSSPKSEQSQSHSAGGATGGAVTMQQQTSASLLSPPAGKPSPTLWFTTEIQQMMYGFGDCRKPLAESASLIEEIVHQQMVTLLYQAEDIARMRNARFVGIEDFLFLLRKDKVKLRRLMRFMTLKDIKNTTLRGLDNEEENSEAGVEIKQPPKKRRKICSDFLNTIDQTGELVLLLDDDCTDHVKYERALRVELLTRTMDTQQYIEFCEARQASFTPRYKIQKFKDWLMAGLTLDIKPNPLGMEVLAYMAYETVAQVVDLALIVKHDQRVRVDEPLSVTMPAVCMSHDLPLSLQGSDGLLTTVASSALKSPPMQKAPSPSSTSPPTTPTTPCSLNSSSGGATQTPSQSSLNLSGNKSKSKKKKKGGSVASRDLFTADAITPTEIMEAMRRYGQCVGPFADFSKCPLLNPVEHLLCV